MTAFAMDVRELSFDEIDSVSGGMSGEDMAISFAIGVAATLAAPHIAAAVVAVGGVVLLGAAINLAVAAPAY